MAPWPVDEKARYEQQTDEPDTGDAQGRRLVDLERVYGFDDVNTPQEGGGAKGRQEQGPDAVGEHERGLLLPEYPPGVNRKIRILFREMFVRAEMVSVCFTPPDTKTR